MGLAAVACKVIGTVLNLDKQKLTEGKELIKYFCAPCAPTKSERRQNAQPAQSMPRRNGRLFKSYNIRDVETEMAIQQKLIEVPRAGVRVGGISPRPGNQ